MMNKKLRVVLFATVMSFALAACGGSDSDASADDAGANTETQVQDEAPADEGEAPADQGDASADEGEAPADEGDASADEGGASSDEAYVSSVPFGLNYGAEPESYVGNWVLTKAYTAADGELEVAADACYLNIEISIDANKLVDEAAYIHADATNLKGTLSFNHADIAVEDYSCTGNWDKWTVVDVVGEGEAYFKGAIEFKVRDDDEGIFFDVLTGVTVEDMELFDVLGMTADGQLVLGYSEDNIVRAGDDEWAYAYIFTKAE